MERIKRMDNVEFDLIERAKNGDRQALDELLLREQKFIFNLMYQLTGDEATADDLTQDAFISACSSLHNFRCEASFRTWLSKIAFNLFRQKIRRKPPHVSICLEKISVPSSDETPERTVVKRELQWCILHTLQQHVPKNYRSVLILRDLQNFSYKDISEILGLSISDTKTRIHRARQIFRNHFINSKCKAFVEDYRCICEGISKL
jgi:RNA polymerase sigma-70 factor (ECF subfamily)